MSWQENHYEASRREQAERDKLNQESKQREALARARAELRKQKRDARKERQRGISWATSTSERREIKRKFDEDIEGIDTSIEANKKARDNEPQHDKSDDIVEGDSADSYLEEIAESRLTPFYVYYTGDSLVVKEGTVNSVIATGLEPSGEPNTLWLKATLDTSQNVTAVAVETSEPSADSATQAKLLIASISWSNGVPTITNYLSGSQQLASCGDTHYWGAV
jgi:uncharacterized membrane protein YqiK